MHLLLHVRRLPSEFVCQRGDFFVYLADGVRVLLFHALLRCLRVVISKVHSDGLVVRVDGSLCGVPNHNMPVTNSTGNTGVQLLTLNFFTSVARSWLSLDTSAFDCLEMLSTSVEKSPVSPMVS